MNKKFGHSNTGISARKNLTDYKTFLKVCFTYGFPFPSDSTQQEAYFPKPPDLPMALSFTASSYQYAGHTQAKRNIVDLCSCTLNSTGAGVLEPLRHCLLRVLQTQAIHPILQ